MKSDKELGFTGNAEAYDIFARLYNEFAEKLELLGAEGDLFDDLQRLCLASRQIYV